MQSVQLVKVNNVKIMAKFDELDKVAKEHGVGGGSDYLRIKEEGIYPVRIVSEYEVIQKFGYSGGRRWVMNLGKDSGVYYPGVTDEKDDDVRNNTEFIMHVIVRGEGDDPDEIKLLFANWTTVSGIRDLAKDPEYAFDEETGLPPYDIKIKKEINGPATNPSSHEYSVLPARENTPLTGDEKEDIAQLTPIKEVVEKMKERELEKIKAGEYEDIGVKFVGEEGVEEAQAASDEFDQITADEE